MASNSNAFEMPVLYTTPDDLDLSNPKAGRRKLEYLLSIPYKVLHEDRTVLLGSARQGNLGELFVCKKNEPALTYYLSYEAKKIEQLGSAATQVALWRRYAPGLEGTSRIIYSLLDEYDAVISDPSTTPAGQRFWIDRMAEAFVKGWTIGLVDGDLVRPYDGGPLLEWCQALDASRGKDQSKRRCFFISTRPVAR